MTDQKRDESRDLHFETPTAAGGECHYVPHSDLAAAETESLKHRRALQRLIRVATAHNSRTSKYLSANDMTEIDAAIREATEAL